MTYYTQLLWTESQGGWEPDIFVPPSPPAHSSIIGLCQNKYAREVSFSTPPSYLTAPIGAEKFILTHSFMRTHPIAPSQPNSPISQPPVTDLVLTGRGASMGVGVGESKGEDAHTGHKHFGFRLNSTWLNSKDMNPSAALFWQWNQALSYIGEVIQISPMFVLSTIYPGSR